MPDLLHRLRKKGEITKTAFDEIADALGPRVRKAKPSVRDKDDIDFLRQLISESGSLEYAGRIADRHARKYQTGLARFLANHPDSIHSQFLSDIGAFTVQRTR